jgi:hypothetical protein
VGGRGRAGWRANRHAVINAGMLGSSILDVGAVLIFDCVDVEFHSAGRKRKRSCGGLAAGLTCKTEREGRESALG